MDQHVGSHGEDIEDHAEEHSGSRTDPESTGTGSDSAATTTGAAGRRYRIIAVRFGWLLWVSWF